MFNKDKLFSICISFSLSPSLLICVDRIGFDSFEVNEGALTGTVRHERESQMLMKKNAGVRKGCIAIILQHQLQHLEK